MEELKSLFGDSSLSYDEFEEKLSKSGDTIKLANLKTGKYVDNDKFTKVESDLSSMTEKYNALVESTKDYDELKKNYETSQASYSELQNKYTQMERMNQIDKSNVNPKFAKFVYNEVNGQVTDKKDFQTCLAEYLKENKEFLSNNQGNYVNLQSGGGQLASDNEVMNKMIRKRGN